MSSQAGKFRAENWALPPVSWHGTLLLAWDTTSKEGFLLSVGERTQCPGPRAAAVILLMAQAMSTGTQRQIYACPCSGTRPLHGGVVPSPDTRTPPTTALGCAAVRCLLFLRCVSALCRLHIGDVPLAAHLRAPLRIAFSLTSNPSSPCCSLIPLLLLH